MLNFKINANDVTANINLFSCFNIVIDIVISYFISY